MITFLLTENDAEFLLSLLRAKRLRLQKELSEEYDNLDIEKQRTIDLINRLNIAMEKE